MNKNLNRKNLDLKKPPIFLAAFSNVSFPQYLFTVCLFRVDILIDYASALDAGGVSTCIASRDGGACYRS